MKPNESRSESIYVGNTFPVPSDYTASAWTAKSDDTTVATVSAEDGGAGAALTITGVKVGSTKVTIENADAVYTYTITVSKEQISGGAQSVMVNAYIDLPAECSTLKWTATSANSNVASVSASGNAGTRVRVTGVAAGGPVTVTVTTDAKVYTYAVTVNSKEIVNRTPDGALVVYEGESIPITEPSGASDNWASMNTDKATVNANGSTATISGVKAGNTTVWVEDATHLYQYAVQVKAKTPHNADPQFVLAGGTLEIPLVTGWKNVATSSATYATASASGDTLTVTGVAEGQATVSYETGMDTYTYPIVVLDPHEVRFCAGDKVQIWYHNTASKTWYIYVNGVRHPVGELVTGNQMSVTLNADQHPGTDTDIIATADIVGSQENGDLIVISDGENYYAYHMSVASPRVLRLGESTTMECATVAVNTWTAAVDDQYQGLITATCTAGPAHRTTATLTAGQTPAEETYVTISNQRHDSQEVNAQGAVYTLKTEIYGAQMIAVHMSAGTTMDVAWGYRDGTDATVYTVEAAEDVMATAGDRDDKSQVGYLNASSDVAFAFAEGGNIGKTVKATLSVPAGAALGDFYAYRVMAGEEEVITYLVNVTSTFSMPKGFTAPGVMYGQSTPWQARSSDALNFNVQSVQSGARYTLSITGYAVGDYTVWSTNQTVSADYWAIKARIYDSKVYDIDLAPGATTNLTVTTALGPWTLTGGGTLTTVTADDLSRWDVTVTITAGTAEGPETITMSSPYAVATFNVYVGAVGKEKVRVSDVKHVTLGDQLVLPLECVDSNWTAASTDPTVARAPERGSLGETVKVAALKVGTTTMIVENETTVYIYTVSVDRNENEIPALVIGVGESVTNAFTGLLEGATSVVTADRTVAEVRVENGRYIVTGVQDGTVNLRITTPNTVYNQKVIVHERHIDKYVDLVLANDSTSTYSFTFDDVIAITNVNPDRIEIAQNGNRLTFTPKAVGEGQVYVSCYVDGLTQSSTLHYFFTIRRLSDSELEVVNYDEGYVAYKGASEVREDGKDLVIVFTNTLDAGVFVIPDSFTAKIDMLAVGGGGGGGSPAKLGQGGGGGGAGGYSFVDDKHLTSGTFGVDVGAGGPSAAGQLGQSIAGLSGAPSFVTNSFGHIYAMASGGGGGAAPSSASFEGILGGSGGGGAWYERNAGQGGIGTDGQGNDGGQPTTYNCGGGGGGASGVGGADGSSGAGRESDISGTQTLYSLGGLGGRADSAEPAAAVTGPGFGGNGGNGGPGSSGADGIVVLRLSALYKNVMVPVPTTNDLVTARFKWEDGETYVPFDYENKYFRSPSNSHPYLWSDVIDHITGTTNVVCELGGEGGTNHVGVGYYNFTIWLKDGFSWVDENDAVYGSTGGQRYMWTVTEDLNNVDAVIDVKKEVVWLDTSNAVVTISSASSPEMSGGGTPNVLFMGSICDRHNLTAETVQSVMTNLVSKANVDWFFYNNLSGEYMNTDPCSSGHFDQGDTVTGLPTLIHSAHHNLLAYLTLIDERLNPDYASKYDYIVIEFDTDRMFEYIPEYTGDNVALANRVAQYLKPYYENNSVIWVVDNSTDRNPWGSAEGFWWTPSSWHEDSAPYPVDGKWNLEVALLDPVLYLSKDNGERYVKTEACTYNNNNYTAYFANRYPTQATYDNSAKVLELLDNTINVKPYNLSFADKIVNPADGLAITGVTVIGCTNTVDGAASKDAADWFDIITWDAETQETEFNEDARTIGINGAALSVNLETNMVEGVLSNVAVKVYTRFQTHVRDVGGFCTSEGASYNQQTGLYEKNPNDGAAHLWMVDESGVAIGVEGEAETTILWTYAAYPITARAVEGEIYINGMVANPLSLIEGTDVPVYYRGRGGYRLAALIVDGTERTITPERQCSYVFEDLSDSHDIQVVYEPFYGTISSEPATYVYDGAPHVFPVTLGEGWEFLYETEVRYALSADADESEYLNEADFLAYCATNGVTNVTDVGKYTYYYRVFAKQPGYGATLQEAGWVWINTGVVGSDTVEITPAPLVAKPDYMYIPYNTVDFPEDQATYTITGFVNGEDASVINTNGWHVHSDYKKGDRAGSYVTFMESDTGDMPDVAVIGNYKVFVRPGVLDVIKNSILVRNVAQAGVLDPEDPYTDTGVDPIEKEYDGVATNLVIEITLQGSDEKPETLADYTITYRVGDEGEWTSTLPRPVHAGTYKVWYAIESEPNHFPATNYQYIVVNPRPVTLESASGSKVYDKAPLVVNEVQVAEDSKDFVAGEGVTTQTTGSQTGVGSSANTFTHEFNEGTLEADYVITHVDGTLEVTLAQIEINDVPQPLDPSFPLDQDENGVDAVEMYYSGVATNIFVTVTSSEAETFTVRYSTDRQNWSAENPSFVDVGNHVVFYSVEAYGYAPVTNFSFVVIKPREIIVTAEDSGKMPGAGDDPELTWETKTDVFSPDPPAGFWDAALEELEGEIVISRAPGEARGRYPITVTGPTTLQDGNVKVIYVPAVFSIAGDIEAAGLWITDHADAGDGKLHLAFKPKTNLKLSPSIVLQLMSMGRIKVAYASSVADLATAERRTAVLRDPTAELDVDKGWIWITIDPSDIKTRPLYWQIFVEQANLK